MLKDKTNIDSEKLINEVLEADIDFTLPENFADVMAEKIGRRFAWEQYIREFLIYLAVIAGIVMVSAVMAFVFFDANWKDWQNFITTNLSLLAGINILVVFVLFADRVLLRYFMYQSSPD